MSKPKFKVGDKVKILDGRNINCYTGNWVSDLAAYIGKIGTIVKVIDWSENRFGYKLKEFSSNCGMQWTFDERGLELANSEKIIIYRDKNDSSKVIAKNTATGKTGVAKCNPADEFDFETGAKLAFDRLLGVKSEKDEPKYYNGKAICIDTEGDSDFTVGKIYRFKNGKTSDNSGDSRPMGYAIQNLDEYNCKSRYTFIPLIED